MASARIAANELAGRLSNFYSMYPMTRSTRAIGLGVATSATLLALGGWWHWEWEFARTVNFANAAARGDTVAVRAFLASGVSPNAQNFHQLSALQLAATEGHSETVRLLLDKGAEPNNALRDAVYGGHMDILSMLLASGAKVTGSAGISALSVAVSRRDGAMIALLLQHSVPLNVPDEYGMLPIQQAARSGDWKTFHLLLEHGANLTLRSPDGMTTLMYAASSEEADGATICRYLLDYGADVNAKDEDGRTALLYVLYFLRDQPMSHSEVSVLNLLLQRGADVNARDKDGMSALHYADEFRNAAAKVLLQSEGARY